MNKALIVLFVVLITTNSYSQTDNWAPNYGFSNFTTCPTHPTGISPNLIFDKCPGWTNPTQNSPDFIHACNTNGPQGGVPNNILARDSHTTSKMP